MAPRKTLILHPDDGIRTAADLLRAGELVAFPTETVYGLGADAANGRAVAAIFAAKNRPAFNPLIVHVADTAQARRLVEWPDTAERLATAFWPGPLTLVLPVLKHAEVAAITRAGHDTLAVRVPAHPVAQALLTAFGAPVAAPSANPSGRISPTTAAHVRDGLGGRIAAILDGGPCPVGLESTIVGLCPGPELLRPGGLARDALEAALGQTLMDRAQSAPLNAPGQLASHYAPNAPLRLNARAARPGEVLLGFGPIPGDVNLSPSSDLHEAAANLFAHLHDLDRKGRPIAVAPIPTHGLGLAINDRLRRAAAPRG